MADRKLTPKEVQKLGLELQNMKCSCEILLAKKLEAFNKKMCRYGFQVSSVDIIIQNTDENRQFEIDINIQ